MRWFFLAIAVTAFALSWGLGSQFLLLAAFLVMAGNFATFCLLYEQPANRARARVAHQLRGMNPNTDAAHRLQTAAIAPNNADRRLGFGPMVIINLITGLLALGLLVYTIMIRLM